MKILAVTCFTGRKDLCEMTERMLTRLRECLPDIVISVVNQGAEDAEAAHMVSDYFTRVPSNVGFAYGMNKAIDGAIAKRFKPDYVLCINNDIEMPHDNWLNRLISEADDAHVMVPGTDKTALNAMKGPSNIHSFTVDEMSAYCWLVPFRFCEYLKWRHQFWLFSEDFAPAYGEDNWTSILLSHKFGNELFKIVPKAWVRHLKGKTADAVKLNRKKTSRVLREKIISMISGREPIDPKLRKRMDWYKKVLRC